MMYVLVSSKITSSERLHSMHVVCRKMRENSTHIMANFFLLFAMLSS